MPYFDDDDDDDDDDNDEDDDVASLPHCQGARLAFHSHASVHKMGDFQFSVLTSALMS